MVDLEKSFSIESGLSFDDKIGMFYGNLDPSQTFVGNTGEAPVGSIYLSKVDSTLTNIYQRWGTGDLDWRRVFFGSLPGWEGKLIALFWAEPVINKKDWFSVGAAVGENAAYLFPFPVVIREIIIMAQSVSSASQDVILKIADSPDTLIHNFPKTQTEIIHIATGLDWTVPAGKKIRLRAGTGNGNIKDVIVNILAERRT